MRRGCDALVACVGVAAAVVLIARYRRRRAQCDQQLEDKFAVAVVDYTAADAAKKLTDSLKSTGFAVLTNSPVSNDLIQDVYSEWREFMIRLHKEATDNLPGNLSEKYKFDLTTQNGYFPCAAAEQAKGAKARDLKHYYQCYFPHGRYPKEVSDNAEQLWKGLTALGKTLVTWIDANMPAEIKATIEQKIGKGTTLMDCVSDERTMMRILHYPGSLGADEAPGAVRAAAHEDINLITILPAGSSRGLQVKSNQSGEWYEVPLVPGSIVINVGDMMQEMSERAYISTTHRVVKMEEDAPAVDAFGTGDRMSTPCFIHLKEKCPMSAQYGSAEHYLKARLVTLGVLPPSVLEGFLEEFPGGVIPGWDKNSE